MSDDSLRILWVKSGPLLPLNTGGRRRTHAMLEHLAKRHEVTYLANLAEGQLLDPGEEGSPYAKEKIWIPSREPAEGSVAYLAEALCNLLFSTRPLVLDRYENPKLRERLLELDGSGRFDLVICDFLTPAVSFDFDQLATPAILFQHNVEAQIWKRLAREKKNLATQLYFRDQYSRMFEAERLLSEKFESVITVSPEDAERCREDYGLSNVLGAVATGVDTDFFRPPERAAPASGRIGFLGSMDWMPNIECVHYFVREILPRVRKNLPEARFRVIGRNPASSVRRLGEEDHGIEITGTVEDVRLHLDQCDLVVVPLQSGGGTRIKIFEAMAQGVPVVSTTIGAEGLPVKDGTDILIADSAEAFADACSILLEDRELRERLRSAARAKVVREHSWEAVVEEFVRFCRIGMRR